MEKFFYAKFSPEKTETAGDWQVSLGNKLCNVFTEWNWDGENFTLTNDRYGFYPIYYFQSENEFAVSPAITKLLEFDKKPSFDEDAFAVFLRLGWLIGEDTLFKSIRAVPPGSILTWHNGKLNLTSKGVIKSKPTKISRKEAVVVYAELFQKAIEKTLTEDENFAVPLSGGRDSRHILFSLCQAGKKPSACLTILHPPPRPNEDFRIAKKICETLNIEHHPVHQPESRYNNEIRKNKITGYCVYEHGWFLPMADYVRQRWQTIYDGIAGDMLSSGLYLDEDKKVLQVYQQGNLEKLPEKILEPEGYIPKLLTDEFYRKFNRERAENHLYKEAVRYAEEPNPVGSFYFWNRTRRCVALSPFRILGSSVNVVTPYLDTDVYDFLATLPADLLVDQRFHTETITYAFPDFAFIPYERKNPHPNLDSRNFRDYSQAILRFSLTARKRNLTNRLFFLTRFLRGLADKNYSRAVTEFGEQAINLLQMERL